jgi:Ca2+-binding EF-hand superfamily protein
MKSLVIVPTLAILLGVALLLGAVINANAGHHDCSMMSSEMSAMDSNNDGGITLEEYTDYHKERLQWSFKALDTDNDNTISSNEWETFLKMHSFGNGYEKNEQS